MFSHVSSASLMRSTKCALRHAQNSFFRKVNNLKIFKAIILPYILINDFETFRP